MKMMHDVIIIGAGPAGSRAAERLARQGHTVLVLERNAAPGGKTCAGIIGKECADAFGVEESVILRTVSSATLCSPGGTSLRVERDAPQACILDRPAFDRMMTDRARAAGTDYLFNRRVTGVTVLPDRATVVCDTDGGETAFEGQAVILACGYAPNLIARLGFGVFRDACTGAQAEVPGDIDEVAVYFGDVAPGFFGWLVPAAPGMVRVGLLSRRDAGTKLKAWLAALADSGCIGTADADIRHGGIPLRPLQTTYKDRLLAVGDAAGQVKPLTGGGIYYGLLGADIAAETLHRAIEAGNFTRQTLSRYEEAWHDLLGDELRWGYRGRKLYERLGNRTVDRLFAWLHNSGTDHALLSASDVAFDWHSRAMKQVLRHGLAALPRRLFKLTKQTENG